MRRSTWAQVQVRVGDAERESAVAALGEHFGAGRLTLEEYDQRSSHAFAARTTGDLARLFGDLPLLPPPPEPPAGRLSIGFAPVVLVVIALVVLSQLPWPLMLIVGWIWWSRTFRHWSRGRGRTAQTIGSRRAVRGTCA